MSVLCVCNNNVNVYVCHMADVFPIEDDVPAGAAAAAGFCFEAAAGAAAGGPGFFFSFVFMPSMGSVP